MNHQCYTTYESSMSFMPIHCCFISILNYLYSIPLNFSFGRTSYTMNLRPQCRVEQEWHGMRFFDETLHCMDKDDYVYVPVRSCMNAYMHIYIHTKSH